MIPMLSVSMQVCVCVAEDTVQLLSFFFFSFFKKEEKSIQEQQKQNESVLLIFMKTIQIELEGTTCCLCSMPV